MSKFLLNFQWIFGKIFPIETDVNYIFANIKLTNWYNCRYGSYILTKDVYEEATSTSPMFGLDCEMCLTTSNILELTRISIVDEDMDVSTVLYVCTLNDKNM